MTQRFSSQDGERPALASPAQVTHPASALRIRTPESPPGAGPAFPRPPQGSATSSASFPAEPGGNAESPPPPIPHRFRDTGTHAPQPHRHAKPGPLPLEHASGDLLLKTHKHSCSHSSSPQEYPDGPHTREGLQHVSPPQLALPVLNRASLRRPLSATGAVPIHPRARWHRGTL